MTANDILATLACLLQRRNALDNEIAELIGRPAHASHLGEFVAAEIFNIDLMQSASHKGSDGYFASGPLTGQSVNVKKYSLQESILDIRPDALPDFYLVLTGPRTSMMTSRGTSQPWYIESVYLFEAAPLVQQLQERGLKINEATSVRRHYWDSAEIYPTQTNTTLILTPEQRSLLALFKR